MHIEERKQVHVKRGRKAPVSHNYLVGKIAILVLEISIDFILFYFFNKPINHNHIKIHNNTPNIYTHII